jgi:hypothetical protein
MSKQAALGDVRPTSADQRYMGKPFQGTIAQAIKQAKAAPEHPLPNVTEAAAAGVSLGRYELLSFLGVL